MDQEMLSLLSHFDCVEEVVQTLLVSDAEADYRIELLRCHKEPQPGYKPRIFRQEAVTVPPDYRSPKAREMLVWRDYEMGFASTDDLNVALKMAVVVIEQKRSR